MNKRIARLREQSCNARPCLSAERALLVTEFYRENDGKFSVPVMRALNFKNLCEKKTIHIGDDFLSIINQLIKFDHIVFDSAVYWYSMSAQLKVFFDKLSGPTYNRKKPWQTV